MNHLKTEGRAEIKLFHKEHLFGFVLLERLNYYCINLFQNSVSLKFYCIC